MTNQPPIPQPPVLGDIWPPPPPHQNPPPPPRLNNHHEPAPTAGFAVTALVCGTVGTTLGLIPLLFFIAAPLGIIGATFGAIAIARHGPRRRPMAIIGTLLSAAALTLGVIGWGIVTDATNDVVDEIEQVDDDIDRLDDPVTPTQADQPAGNCTRRDENGNATDCATPTIDRGSS